MNYIGISYVFVISAFFIRQVSFILSTFATINHNSNGNKHHITDTGTAKAAHAA